MQREKAAVKKILGAYDKCGAGDTAAHHACRAFERQHARAPSSEEKEVLRPLYRRYKELKVRLDGADTPAASPDKPSLAPPLPPLQSEPEPGA